MRNLFILHTQYNLIIGSGIALKKTHDDNILVLYPEFRVSETILESLKQVFDRVVLVDDAYYHTNSIMKKEWHLWQTLMKTKALWNESFDMVFLSQENAFDTLLLSKIAKKKEFVCCSIEEDAYYSLNEELNRSGYRMITKRKTILGVARSIVRRLVCGKNRFYENVYCYGMNSNITKAHILFPPSVRQEMMHKELIEVTEDQLNSGISALYRWVKTEYPEGDKYLLIVFDLMSRYKDKQLVQSIVKKAIEVAIENGYVVLAKYHPRETDKFEHVEGVYVIDQLVPGEKILNDLKDKHIVVFGSATTVCIVAVKMNHKVLSIAPLEYADNPVMLKKMHQMGITMIDKHANKEQIMRRTFH